MPTYEHVCENGHTFEEFQSIVAKAIEVCPICGARAERKISGGTGLIFKGSGFYITDYGRKGGGNDKMSGSPIKPKTEKEAAPAPKKDSSSSDKES